MGTLTINGKRIKVDDSFAQLSPADQQRTVEEIAAQMGGAHAPQTRATWARPLGATAPGNIDLNARKVFNAPDGSYRTENSISIGTDQGEVLIPTVVNGQQLSEEDAIRHYQQTGESLGTFANPEAANAYADQLHRRQEKRYAPPAPQINMSVSDRFAAMPKQAPARPDLMNSTAATVNGLVASVPFLQETSDALIGVAGMPFGKDYGETVRGLQDKRRQIAEAAPISRAGGQVVGTIAGMGMLGTTQAGKEALGLTGKWLPSAWDDGGRVVNSALSNAGYSGLQSLAAGKQGGEVLADMGNDAAIGVASPFVGKGIELAGSALGSNVVRPIATMLNRENEAIQRTSRAVAQDINVGGVMSGADEATARQAGVPVMNADRFGQATRTLARTAANISPEASGMLRRTVDDRFANQAHRAVSFTNRLMNGATDDLALQEQLRVAARRANRPAYDRAYNSRSAQSIWDGNIQGLMQSPEFLAAVRSAERAGATEAAISGQRAVRSPFVFDDAGGWQLRRNADGSQAVPNLPFWDVVQRELRAAAEALGPRERTAASRLGQLRTQLLDNLDRRVPEFRDARRGAAAYFGAEDAIDAGRQAFNTPRQLPEIRNAVGRMSQAERDAFSVGFASELMDRLRATGDRQNVIQQVFGSPSMRERVQIALGPQRARDLEAYVRVESIVDQLRGAVTGNSTTAQQLIAAGVLGGGAGLWTSGGNVQTGLTWAAIAGLGRRGMQAMGKRVDDQVMRRVAEMLVSQDPAVLRRAVHNATLSTQHMQALESIMQGLEMTGRGASLAMTN